MKALFIGGTGTISSGITRLLAEDENWELTLLNRGNRNEDLPEQVKTITADISNEEEVARLLEGKSYDVVAEFIGFTADQVERDIRLFTGKTKQYIFISTCAAYNTPPTSPWMTEGMIQRNPYSRYAQNKIACEQALFRAFCEADFPITIVRPSHTYSERLLPFCLESPKGSWPVIQRMLDGKPIIMPGDGSSLWAITYNEDFAKGFIGLMGNNHAIGEAVHITNDEWITWDQMAQTVAEELGVPYRPFYIPTETLCTIAPELTAGLNGDKRHSVIYDNTKIKHLVPTYCATVSWRQGVRHALSVIMANEEYRPQDPVFDEWCDRLIAIYEEATAKAVQELPKLY